MVVDWRSLTAGAVLNDGRGLAIEQQQQRGAAAAISSPRADCAAEIESEASKQFACHDGTSLPRLSAFNGTAHPNFDRVAKPRADRER